MRFTKSRWLFWTSNANRESRMNVIREFKKRKTVPPKKSSRPKKEPKKRSKRPRKELLKPRIKPRSKRRKSRNSMRKKRTSRRRKLGSIRGRWIRSSGRQREGRGKRSVMPNRSIEKNWSSKKRRGRKECKSMNRR
jgi:hypothetical protein